jgi:hypothetical protein
MEITQRDSDSPSSALSPSQSQPSSLASIIAGTMVSLAAMSAIFAGWMTDKIPVWWHAVGAMLVATLPTSALADLARGVAKRFLPGGK